jgi:hypothetical protein
MQDDHLAAAIAAAWLALPEGEQVLLGFICAMHPSAAHWVDCGAGKWWHAF